MRATDDTENDGTSDAVDLTATSNNGRDKRVPS